MLLDVTDVSFTYPGSSVEAVSGLSFQLPDTGVIGLVGMNGSGKSTLLSLIFRYAFAYGGGDYLRRKASYEACESP